MGSLVQKGSHAMRRGEHKGAARLGNAWAIPKDAEKPKDARIKCGKYIKKKRV